MHPQPSLFQKLHSQIQGALLSSRRPLQHLTHAVQNLDIRPAADSRPRHTPVVSSTPHPNTPRVQTGSLFVQSAKPDDVLKKCRPQPAALCKLLPPLPHPHEKGVARGTQEDEAGVYQFPLVGENAVRDRVRPKQDPFQEQLAPRSPRRMQAVGLLPSPEMINPHTALLPQQAFVPPPSPRRHLENRRPSCLCNPSLRDLRHSAQRTTQTAAHAPLIRSSNLFRPFAMHIRRDTQRRKKPANRCLLPKLRRVDSTGRAAVRCQTLLAGICHVPDLRLPSLKHVSNLRLCCTLPQHVSHRPILIEPADPSPPRILRRPEGIAHSAQRLCDEAMPSKGVCGEDSLPAEKRTFAQYRPLSPVQAATKFDSRARSCRPPKQLSNHALAQRYRHAVLLHALRRRRPRCHSGAHRCLQSSGDPSPSLAACQRFEHSPLPCTFVGLPPQQATPTLKCDAKQSFRRLRRRAHAVPLQDWLSGLPRTTRSLLTGLTVQVIWLSTVVVRGTRCLVGILKLLVEGAPAGRAPCWRGSHHDAERGRCRRRSRRRRQRRRSSLVGTRSRRRLGGQRPCPRPPYRGTGWRVGHGDKRGTRNGRRIERRRGRCEHGHTGTRVRRRRESRFVRAATLGTQVIGVCGAVVFPHPRPLHPGQQSGRHLLSVCVCRVKTPHHVTRPPPNVLRCNLFVRQHVAPLLTAHGNHALHWSTACYALWPFATIFDLCVLCAVSTICEIDV